MNKANHSSQNSYDFTPIIGAETVGADYYTFPTTAKTSKRTYGNLELLEVRQSLGKQTSKPEHVNPAYLLELHTIHRYIHHEFSRQSCREGLWKRAVENLYKRINFLQLNIEFLQDDITEDEFEQTLTAREHEYVISFKNVNDNLEAEAIHDIVRAIGRSFDVHEVAELFGVEPESLLMMQMQADKGKAHKPSARLSSGR